MKKNYLILIPISLLITIILLLLTNNIYFIDNTFYKLVMHNDFLTLFFKELTNFGNYIYIIAICILLLLFYKKKKDLFFLYKITIISTILNIVLKNIFARPRPNLMHLVTENSYSFPSGHASVACIFYGYLIYLIRKSNLNIYLKQILTILLVVLILLIGYSRIYLNVHYFSDVIAGYMISFILLFIGIKRKK